MLDYANARGLRAGICNESNLEQLLALTDQGLPAIVMADWNFGSGHRPSVKRELDGLGTTYVVVLGSKIVDDEKRIVVVHPTLGVRVIQAHAHRNAANDSRVTLVFRDATNH